MSIEFTRICKNFNAAAFDRRARTYFCKKRSILHNNGTYTLHIGAIVIKYNKSLRTERTMSLLELFITAVALAMDAFAVAICKGLTVEKVKLRHAVITGVWFGGFQMLMPLLGYLCASMFSEYITNFDHWVAFFLLVAIGISMIAEAFKKDEEKKETNPFSFMTMLIMSVATSVDALAVGITFAFLDVNIWVATAFIGATTFILSAVGVKVGNVFGAGKKNIAEIAGGVILILLGVKILLQHLGVINF